MMDKTEQAALIATVREEVLDEAKSIVVSDRNTDYGSPEHNFGRIAQLWSVFIGIKVEPYEVAAMLAMVKIARIMTSPKKLDNWVDLAGYAACGAEVRPE